MQPVPLCTGTSRGFKMVRIDWRLLQRVYQALIEFGALYLQSLAATTMTWSPLNDQLCLCLSVIRLGWNPRCSESVLETHHHKWVNATQNSLLQHQVYLVDNASPSQRSGKKHTSHSRKRTQIQILSHLAVSVFLSVLTSRFKAIFFFTTKKKT